MHKKISQLHHDGFTLIEVMVSVSIFVIIITIGIGSLLTVNRALQKSRIERQSTDSLAYVMDTITRRLRTGRNYVVSGGNTSISFTEQNDTAVDNGTGKTIEFYLGNTGGTGGAILMREGTDIPYAITPPEIDITEFNVQVMRGNVQPLALISIKAIIKNQNQESIVAIQSAVSQRPFESSSAQPVIP